MGGTLEKRLIESLPESHLLRRGLCVLVRAALYVAGVGRDTL